MKLLMPPKLRMLLTARQQNPRPLRLRLWKPPQRRQLNKENILAYNSTEIKSKLWCFFSLPQIIYMHYKEEITLPPTEKKIKILYKSYLSCPHIFSIDYLLR